MNIGQRLFGGGATGPVNNKFLSLSSISGLISIFLNAAFALAGLILLFFFILGGIGMISSAGESDPKKAEEAKKTITSAIIGFVIVFTSFWIVKLIGKFIGLPDNFI